jgi:L-asparaginase
MNDLRSASFVSEVFAPEAYPDINFTHSSPYQILSETISPKHWTKLAAHIHSIQSPPPDAIFITHGTDTLAYTAAFLSLVFSETDIPIFLISSDKPLSDRAANGTAHIPAAVAAVRTSIPPGVYVPYKNPGFDEVIMHKGEEIMQAGDNSDSFYSMKNIAGKHDANNAIPIADNVIPDLIRNPLHNITSAKILQIRPYPGIDYDVYDLTGIDAVLHGTYHSYTADADALIAFAKKAADLSKKVFLAPVPSVPEKQYATTKKIIESGYVLPLCDITFEIAYAKLLLYGNITK